MFKRYTLFDLYKLNGKTAFLRQKSEEIKVIDDEIKLLAHDLSEILKRISATSLSAPQIGVLKRMIAVKNPQGGIDVLINPEIIESSRRTITVTESCQSFPRVSLNVKRPRRIVLRALDLDRNEVKIKASKEMAAEYQHEVDHLDGKLFIDLLDPTLKPEIKKAIKKLRSKWN